MLSNTYITENKLLTTVTMADQIIYNKKIDWTHFNYFSSFLGKKESLLVCLEIVFGILTIYNFEKKLMFYFLGLKNCKKMRLSGGKK